MMFHKFSSLPCDLVAYNAAIAACETGGVGLGVGLLCWAEVSAHHEEGVLTWYVMVLALGYDWIDDTYIQKTYRAHWSRCNGHIIA